MVRLVTLMFIAAAAFAPTTWMLGDGSEPETQQSLVRAPEASPGIVVADVGAERLVDPTLAP